MNFHYSICDRVRFLSSWILAHISGLPASRSKKGICNCLGEVEIDPVPHSLDVFQAKMKPEPQ